MSFRTEPLSVSRFTFGTGRIDDPASAEHLAVARAAMEAGVWFHTSHAYGEGRVFEVLRKAFAEDKSQVPHCIFKVDGQSAAGLRETVEICLRGTGKERVDIAQICGNPDPASLRAGGELHQAMCELQERGLVGSYTLEFFSGFSDNLLPVVQEQLFDSVTFYYNTIEREVSSAVWDALQQTATPILALRTLGGNPEYYGNLNPEQRQKLTELYERSGCKDRFEFRFRFLRGVTNVATTIGATGKRMHLNRFIEANAGLQPLPDEMIREIQALHSLWFAIPNQ